MSEPEFKGKERRYGMLKVQTTPFSKTFMVRAFGRDFMFCIMNMQEVAETGQYTDPDEIMHRAQEEPVHKPNELEMDEVWRRLGNIERSVGGSVCTTSCRTNKCQGAQRRVKLKERREVGV
jgi:hypothetical protein